MKILLLGFLYGFVKPASDREKPSVSYGLNQKDKPENNDCGGFELLENTGNSYKYRVKTTSWGGVYKRDTLCLWNTHVRNPETKVTVDIEKFGLQRDDYFYLYCKENTWVTSWDHFSQNRKQNTTSGTERRSDTPTLYSAFNKFFNRHRLKFGQHSFAGLSGEDGKKGYQCKGDTQIFLISYSLKKENSHIGAWFNVTVEEPLQLDYSIVKLNFAISDYRVGFKTSVVNQASSTCTPEVVIYFQDSWIRPIRFTGLDITRNGGSITYSNYVKSPNSAIDKVTMKASCNDSWRGWIEIVTPAGTKKCTYNGHSWYFVDGDTDSHYGSYFKEGTGVTNGRTITLNCGGSTSRIDQKNPPQTSSSYQNRPPLPLIPKPTWSKSDYRVGFKTSVVNQASSTCTPEVSIYFQDSSINPIKFTGLDITRKGGSTTYTNFVKRPNSSIGKVTMKASCNDSWRGWIEIVTPTGTRKCTYNGNSWYFVDGDTDSHYGSYFKKGTGVTNGRTITLNC